MSELRLRKSLLANYYLSLEPLRKELTIYRSLIEPVAGSGETDFFDSTGGASLYVDRLTGEFHFMKAAGGKENLVRMDHAELRNHLAWLDRCRKSTILEQY